MQANAIDICNFDGGWGGGPTEWRRVANIAHAFGVKVMQYLEPQFGLLISTTKKEFTELVFYTRYYINSFLYLGVFLEKYSLN
jgi:L-alanine-DL-glutamate epimerase-like enolase superfamily enzyme